MPDDCSDNDDNGSPRSENIGDTDRESADGSAILEVSIDLGRGLKDTIKVHDADEIDDLVDAFCAKHNLSAVLRPRLAQQISAELVESCSDSLQSPEFSPEESCPSSSHVSDDDTASITSNESFVMASGNISYFDFDFGTKMLFCKPKCVQSASNARKNKTKGKKKRMKISKTSKKAKRKTRKALKITLSTDMLVSSSMPTDEKVAQEESKNNKKQRPIIKRKELTKIKPPCNDASGLQKKELENEKKKSNRRGVYREILEILRSSKHRAAISETSSTLLCTHSRAARRVPDSAEDARLELKRVYSQGR